jgi:acetoin utilization protein AcuB
MKIATIMTKAFVSVSLDDTLFTIKIIFDKANFHHLLVVENNQLEVLFLTETYLRHLVLILLLSAREI